MFRDLNCAAKKPLKTFTNFISEKISVEVGTSIPNGEMFLYFQVYRRFRAIYWKTFKKKKRNGSFESLRRRKLFH